MNESTLKIYEFLKSSGYIDSDREFISIEIKIDIENPPVIKAEYEIRNAIKDGE